MLKVGDRVKCVPPRGPHIGKKATIIEDISLFHGAKWFKVKTDDGIELVTPESYLEAL